MMGSISKRLLTMIPMILGITAVSFVLMQLAPGDPLAMMVDPSIHESDLAQVRENLGLNQPVWIQYWRWLLAVLQGDFGYSFVTGQPVLTVILDRLPATLLLSGSTMVLIVGITFPLGIWAGYKANTAVDHWITVLTFIGMSIPAFWLALVLLLMLSVQLEWFPLSGFQNYAVFEPTVWQQCASILHHMVLPLVTSVLGGLAGLTRYHRSGVVGILNRMYITAARSRGVGPSRLLFQHVAKNAALPIITLLGLMIPGLIGGSFVIEYIFAWPGMGQLGVSSVFARDYPVLMAILVFSSLLIMLGTLISDIVYQWADPRVGRTSV